MTKFMTFDVDFQSRKMAKWITYNIVDSLCLSGLTNHYISFSGNKGYHIDLFFDDYIQIDHAKKLFDYIINLADIKQYFADGSKVEFRPTSGQGVKLPLGRHQKTKKYCGFCLIENGLRVMSKKKSEDYLMSIQRTSKQLVLDLLQEQEAEIKNAKIEVPRTENIISQHRMLDNYNQSEDYSIDRAKDLFFNGLKAPGSRNNSIFLVGLYLKYQGLDAEQVKQELYDWMDRQNADLYSTPLEQCYKEIDATVKTMFKKNYNLSASNKDLTVTYEEIKWIIENCPEKNQKLITYAMLVHSKRHANAQGVFYMTFKHLQEATGLDDNTVQRQINKLAELGVIEIVAHNRAAKKGLKKLPNLYRISLGTIGPELIQGNQFKTDRIDNFNICLKFFFSEKELKKLLPRRQYQSLIG